MPRLTIAFASQPPTKPILIIGEGEAKQVLEIEGMSRASRLYQPKELTEVEEKKRKGKEALAEEAQRKKRASEDDTEEFIKSLKRCEHSVA